MKKLFLGVLMAVTAITSPLLMANTNDKNDQQEVINIYFARHGKTLLNSFDRVQGWIDSPLTKDGVQVAQYLGEGLKGIKFDRFYSSDAGRQRETMAVILKQAGVTDYHLTEMTGLREAFFGGFEGGYNVDMANAGAHTLGMTDSKALFKAMKAGTLSVKESQNALAKSDPKQLAEDYEQVKVRTQATQFRADSQLTIGTQVYGTHAMESYRAMPASKRDFDNNAWHFALDATWKGERWNSKMGIGYTNAKKAGEVGFYPRHMSKNSRGTFISMAYAGDDYMRDGELVLANITEYRLTPELAVGLAGNIGQFNYKGNHVRTGEINAFSRWVPTQPMFKNFTFWAMFGPGWSYKTQGKTPVLTDGHYTRTNTLSSEVIMEYRFKVF
ncbi:TPA: histidine phosphatase family protein [Klebsiella aerogenes]|nr:histidine phosphatase family protein [Klebsiella aerogenes]